jgi:hypothetical protein
MKTTKTKKPVVRRARENRGVRDEPTPPLRWWRTIRADAFDASTARILREAIAAVAIIDEPTLRDAANGQVDHGSGQSGHRLYDSAGLAHGALVGALHLAGFELLASARLAAAFADDYGASYGHLPSNLNSFVRGDLNPGRKLPWGETPSDVKVDLAQDYWLHYLLRNRSTIYRRGIAVQGDCIIVIADHAFVLTHTYGLEKIKVFSPASGKGLPASPDYRIVGRGGSARIVPIHSEVESLDFQIDPKSADKMRQLEQEYLDGHRDAVTRVQINLSLAIRNALDRLQDHRDNRRAA